MENLPVQKKSEIVQGTLVDRRVLPPYAYARPNLGAITLLARVDETIRLLTDVLRPLVVNFEAQEPQPITCTICGPSRNFAGWPQDVLIDHWFQHSLLQRKMAAMGFHS